MMYMGSIMSFLVRAQDTDGRFAMVEYRARPGNEPPPHVHLWEHEIFSVLEGKIEFHCEDQVETVGPGETIFLPKGKAQVLRLWRARYSPGPRFERIEFQRSFCPLKIWNR
jgi:Cupin domain